VFAGAETTGCRNFDLAPARFISSGRTVCDLAQHSPRLAAIQGINPAATSSVNIQARAQHQVDGTSLRFGGASFKVENQDSMRGMVRKPPMGQTANFTLQQPWDHRPDRGFVFCNPGASIVAFVGFVKKKMH